MVRPIHKINLLKREYLLTKNPRKDVIIDKAISDLKELPIMEEGIGGKV